MPELPDLTIVAEELQARATGRLVLDASAPTPILVRATPAELARLTGTAITTASRRGKFLLLGFSREIDGLVPASGELGKFYRLRLKDRGTLK